MTATLTHTDTHSSNDIVTTVEPSDRRTMWRTGAVAGVKAAIATTAIAVGASGLGVSFESAPGEAIPIAGYAQMTLICTALGVLLARSLSRRASQPRRTYIRATVVLTALSVLPDLAVPFDAASKLALVVTHVVAAAIVIPALARLLPEEQVR